MVNGSNTITWEEETLARIRYGKEKRKEEEQNVNEAKNRLAFWVQYTDALEKALELDRQHRGIKVGERSGAVDPERLRSQSVRESLMEIAAANNGILVAVDAVDILVKAGAFADKEHARNALYATLYHNRRYFQKERPGVYRLASPSDVKLPLSM